MAVTDENVSRCVRRVRETEHWTQATATWYQSEPYCTLRPTAM